MHFSSHAIPPMAHGLGRRSGKNVPSQNGEKATTKRHLLSFKRLSAHFPSKCLSGSFGSQKTPGRRTLSDKFAEERGNFSFENLFFVISSYDLDLARYGHERRDCTFALIGKNCPTSMKRSVTTELRGDCLKRDVTFTARYSHERNV